MKHIAFVERVAPNMFVVTFDGSMEDRAELLQEIQAQGVRVGGFSPLGLPLEMMYMDMVKESR